MHQKLRLNILYFIIIKIVGKLRHHDANHAIISHLKWVCIFLGFQTTRKMTYHDNPLCDSFWFAELLRQMDDKFFFIIHL